MPKLNVVPGAQLVFGLTIATAFSALVLAASDATAPLTKPEVNTLIKTAKTPEDHMKLAHYYQYEADKFKSEAEDHREMSAEYIHSPLPKGYPMSQHCNDVSDNLTRASKKAEQLAKLHEAMAKEADAGK
jgi:hypothetical protein